MTSATNPKQIKARKESARRDVDVETYIIQQLMSEPLGRRWVWLQLEFAQIFIGDEELDPARMAFDKGRRNTGLKLLRAVSRHAPQLYVTMTEENSGVKLKEEDDGRPGDSDDSYGSPDYSSE